MEGLRRNGYKQDEPRDDSSQDDPFGLLQLIGIEDETPGSKGLRKSHRSAVPPGFHCRGVQATSQDGLMDPSTQDWVEGLECVRGCAHDHRGPDRVLQDAEGGLLWKTVGADLH